MITGDNFHPVYLSVVYTMFGCKAVVTVPVKVLISACWFSAYCGVDGMTLVCRNGMEPSGPGSSTVNCMVGACELIC